jgi:branched-chain amino acid transport system ATP-binding protein
MLLVEQNLQMALDLADRVYILDQGTVVFDGSARELIDNDQLTASYLGVSGSEESLEKQIRRAKE